MKKVMITVAYDGTRYCGWQIQHNGNTIEAELNHHLSELLAEPIHVIGASRTDSGVHAEGNVAVFTTSARMDPRRISFAMNTRLPEDIRIVDSREVPETFHPRRCHSVKTYRYQILNRTFPDPIRRLYTLFYHWPLDVGRMRQAAACLVGEHDFTTFCTDRPDQLTHVRTIYALEIEQDGPLITLTISGSGFLYNMVRIIVGTLLLVGSGRMSPGEMEAALLARDRSRAGDTARPEGLTLVGIEYPPELLELPARQPEPDEIPDHP